MTTSHGPSRESYQARREAGMWSAAASALPATDTPVSAKRVRGTFSSATGAPALLQRGVPESGTKMVALESPREIPGDGGGPTETERSKPALSGADQKPKNTRARGS